MNSALMQNYSPADSSDPVVDSAQEKTQKAKGAFRTISEVADDLDVQQHVLRFWETKFNQVRPLKRGGGRRYYRPEDVALLKKIHHLLYTEGYTIKGVQKILKGVSKSQLVNEKVEKPLPSQQAAAKAYGENLPQVQSVSQEQTRVAAPVVAEVAVEADDIAEAAQPRSLAEYKAALQETLGELMEIRALLQQAS